MILFSEFFFVICAPQVDNILNLLPLFERRSGVTATQVY